MVAMANCLICLVSFCFKSYSLFVYIPCLCYLLCLRKLVNICCVIICCKLEVLLEYTKYRKFLLYVTSW